MLNVRSASKVGRPDSWTPLRRAEEVPGAPGLLLTVLGEFVLPDGGEVWTGTVVRALSLLGVEEGASRQALSRSRLKGMLRSERIGRRTKWSLTDRGARVLTEGAARIYGFGSVRPHWDGRWLLVLTTVPEQNRHLRARLRARMNWIGLGQVAPGTWVSPWADREADARAVLEELELTAGALSWVGRPGILGEVEGRIGEIWNLVRLARAYEAFAASAHAAAARAGRASTPQDCFSALVRLVHDWRHFPAADPGLPEELLPRPWPGSDAASLFAARRRSWSPLAWSYWRSISGPDSAAISVSS